MKPAPKGAPGTDELLRMKMRWEDLEDFFRMSPTNVPPDDVGAIYTSWLEYKVKRDVRTPERTEREYDGLEAVERRALERGFEPLHSMIRHDPRPLVGPDQSRKKQPDAGWTSLPGPSSSTTAPPIVTSSSSSEGGPSAGAVALAAGVLLGLGGLIWAVARRL